jgi:hypothetical protein
MGADLQSDKEDRMYRPRSTSVTVSGAALLGLALFTVACSSAAEEPLLRQFFRASQLRDNGTLANFAAATFDPRTDGIVSDFEILTVSEDQHEPLMLRELAAASDKARMADEEFSKEMKSYQDQNLAAIERVLKAESAERPVTGRDAAVQKQWRTYRDQAAESAKMVSDARAKLNNARPLVELSAQNANTPIDVLAVQGETVTKVVTIDAEVRSPEGATTQQQMVITMMRGVFNIEGAAEPVNGRWIIAKIDKG